MFWQPFESGFLAFVSERYSAHAHLGIRVPCEPWPVVLLIPLSMHLPFCLLIKSSLWLPMTLAQTCGLNSRTFLSHSYGGQRCRTQGVVADAAPCQGSERESFLDSPTLWFQDVPWFVAVPALGSAFVFTWPSSYPRVLLCVSVRALAKGFRAW